MDEVAVDAGPVGARLFETTPMLGDPAGEQQPQDETIVPHNKLPN